MKELMDPFSLWSSIFFLLLFTYLLFYFLTHNRTSKNTCRNDFRTYPVVGNLPDFLKNRHRFLEWMTEILRKQPTNTVTFRRPGKVQGVITANPMNVEYMLKTNFENYPKGDRFISLLEDFLGRGIFNSDGELWKMQRKTASFEFNTKSLRNFIMEVVEKETTDRLIPLLSQVAETHQTIDLQSILERFAFDNICNVAFNEDPACLATCSAVQAVGGWVEFARAFEDAANFSAGRFMYAFPSMYKFKKFFNIGSERRLRESISIVHNLAMKIIKSRKERALHENIPYDEDLLSRFMASHESSEEFLRDIVVSFILAGRDTTSSSLVWFFWLISSRPDVEQNILKEIEKIRTRNQKSNKIFSFDELREMHYLHASICEALRLYPPVAVDTKKCVEDDVLPDGTFVGKGWFISYVSYAMGRMEGVWGEDCRSFKPERWLKEGVFQPESPYRFPVFHGGPRMCLGKEMAFIQMKSIAACVMERFAIEVLDKEHCPEHVLSLTLRMKGGLPVRVRER